MKKPAKILSLGLVAGIIYLLIINPESSHTFGIHNYAILAILSALTALSARYKFNADHEKVILLTAAGFISATAFPFFYEASLANEIVWKIAFNQAFITLFFAGHAALVGTFMAALFQKISFTGRIPEYSRSNSKEQYYKYPVPE